MGAWRRKRASWAHASPARAARTRAASLGPAFERVAWSGARTIESTSSLKVPRPPASGSDESRRASRDAPWYLEGRRDDRAADPSEPRIRGLCGARAGRVCGLVWNDGRARLLV